MDPRWLFALQVAVYAAFPIGFASLRSDRRLLLLYVYLGTNLALSGLFGQVYSLPLGHGIVVEAGSVAYATLMMTTLVLLFLERDLRVIRNVVVIVIVINAFTFAVYDIAAHALRLDSVPNPHDISPEVFTVSLRIVAVGGALMVLELLALLFVFERLKVRIHSAIRLTAVYLAGFVVALTLDGAVYPVLAYSPRGDVADLARGGIEAKLVLALAFSLPFLVFLTAFRSVMVRYEATPLHLYELFTRPREQIIQELRSERQARLASDRQLAVVGLLARAMTALPGECTVDEALGEAARALSQLPGLGPASFGLLAEMSEEEVVGYGAWAGLTGSDEQFASFTGPGPWVRGRQLDDLVCLRIGAAGEPGGVLAVTVTHDRSAEIAARLDGVSAQITALFGSTLARARHTWSERAPIMSLLADGATRAVFQPVVALRDRSVVGFEGLSRFEGDTSPERRFREAARVGLQVTLEMHAVVTILEAAVDLPPGVPLSVNVSPATLLSSELAAAVEGHDRPIKLEVTEHDPVVDYEAVAAAVARLPGVELVVDDAGSGYASLQHILRLRPQEVKLDRAWVDQIDLDLPRQTLVGAMADFVAQVGARLVAEGIERPEEAATLLRLGVAYGQGFLIAPPAAAATFGTEPEGTRMPTLG